ncbi:PREDICTED: aurora kinase A-interacting protein, partial [Condylura cristata]|uniref:aurora kinase A-interacting protein n=1 Tax=Condylura cristata TaxID=143302 RepID=UPI0003345AC4
CGAVSRPGKGARLELEEALVPRKMAVSPLESWLAARCLLPRPGALFIQKTGSPPPPPNPPAARLRPRRPPLSLQAKFERDLRRIWLRAGLRKAPAGWQTPKIYLKGR